MEIKEYKELNPCIPDNIKKDIRECGAKEEIKEPVYRVAKNGKKDKVAFFSTYEEILEGILPDNEKKYPKNKVITYSTSVYLDKKPCEKFIKCLKKNVATKETYPHPIIIQGRTTNGLVQQTIEREPDYTDKLHVDWWIFKGEVEEVFKNFHELEEV